MIGAAITLMLIERVDLNGHGRWYDSVHQTNPELGKRAQKGERKTETLARLLDLHRSMQGVFGTRHDQPTGSCEALRTVA